MEDMAPDTPEPHESESTANPPHLHEVDVAYGTISGVPRYTQAPLPARLADAAQKAGMSRTRVAVLRYLAHHEEGATIGQISEALDVGAGTIHKHLAELEEARLVLADATAGERQGKRVLYTSNVSLVREQLATIAEYIAPLPNYPSMRFPADDNQAPA